VILALLGVVIVFATLCLRLGHLPLLAPDEERNAEVGREMKESGAWLVPTYNGVAYLDKPAFYFKAVALSLALNGNSEAAARMPSAAFGVGLVLLVFGFCRKVHGTRCGLLAAIVVGTTPLYLANARIVIFDIVLAFFVCGAIFAGFLAEAAEGRARRYWYLLGALSAGFATLVKGPIGFVIPALVLLVFNRVEGRRGAWKRLLAPLNLLVFFAVTLPWFVGLCLAHNDFLQYGLVEESFKRFTTAKRFHRSEPFYFYLLIIAGTFFPWSLLLPEASLATWKERWARNSADRLCLLWSVLVIVFFSVSQSKLPGYILSVAVACGILVARLFDSAWSVPDGRAARLVRRAITAFALVCLLVAVALGVGSSHLSVFARPLRIPASEAARFGQGALGVALLLTGFGVFGLIARYRRSVSMGFLCLALFPPLCVHANVNALDVIFDAKSNRQLARQLSNLPAETELACLQCFPNGLPFYLNRTATLISRNGGELTSNYIISCLEKEPRWPQQIVPVAELDDWLASRTKSVYLIVRQSDRSRLQVIATARNSIVQPLAPGYLGAHLPAPGGL